jgi:hypothetical protein
MLVTTVSYTMERKGSSELRRSPHLSGEHVSLTDEIPLSGKNPSADLSIIRPRTLSVSSPRSGSPSVKPRASSQDTPLSRESSLERKSSDPIARTRAQSRENIKFVWDENISGKINPKDAQLIQHSNKWAEQEENLARVRAEWTARVLAEKEALEREREAQQSGK